MSRLGKTDKLPTPTPPDSDARHRAMIQALSLDASIADPRPDDLSILRQQLGRLPLGQWLIAHRSPAGLPMVMATYPLRICPRNGYRPFPNMLWLTDPALSQAISHLERQGQMALLQEELSRDEAWSKELAADHARYAAVRWNMLLPQDQKLAIARDWQQELAHRGTGGLSPQGTRIKCLHAHVAQHLVMGNTLGQRVMGMI